MSRINAQMGLKPAGKRAMMKLPRDRRLAAALTSAVCPACQRRGARAMPRKGPRAVFCSWCNHFWELAP